MGSMEDGVFLVKIYFSEYIIWYHFYWCFLCLNICRVTRRLCACFEIWSSSNPCWWKEVLLVSLLVFYSSSVRSITRFLLLLLWDPPTRIDSILVIYSEVSYSTFTHVWTVFFVFLSSGSYLFLVVCFLGIFFVLFFFDSKFLAGLCYERGRGYFVLTKQTILYF